MKKKIDVHLSEGTKSAVVYTIASVFSKGLAFITVPIFTRIMSTSDIGTVNLFTTWQNMLGVVVTLSLTAGGYMVALKEFENERDQYESSVLTLTSVSALACFIVYAINPKFWQTITGLNNELLLLMLVGFLFSPALDFWLARQRYEYKYIKPAIVIIGSALLSAILSVIAVLVLKSTEFVAEGRLFANYSITYIIAIILWIWILYKGRTFYSYRFWRFSLFLSIPLIANAFAGQVFNAADRVMIGYMVGNSEVGIYGTLSSLSSISLIVWSAINSSFIPFLYKNIENNKKSVKDIADKLLLFYAAVCVLITFLAPEILRIIATKEYYNAIYIIPPLAAGIFQNSVSNMYANVLLYHKKTVYIMISSIAAAILNIVLNAICIPIFGYMSAAYTTLAAYFVLSFIQFFISRRIHFRVSGSCESVYADVNIFLITVSMTILSLVAIPLYSSSLIRYICIVIMFCSLLVFYLKNRKVLHK